MPDKSEERIWVYAASLRHARVLIAAWRDDYMGMLGNESSKSGLSADFFDDLFSTAASQGQPYPDDVIAKVKDWFDTLNKATEKSAATVAALRENAVNAYGQADQQANQADLALAQTNDSKIANKRPPKSQRLHLAPGRLGRP